VNTNEEVDGSSQPGIVIENIGINKGRDIVKLSDKHNITNASDSSSTDKIRLKPTKKYSINLSTQYDQIGQFKVPLLISHYHESESEKINDEYRQSHSAVELLIKVQTNEVRELLPKSEYRPLPKNKPWLVNRTVKSKPIKRIDVDNNLRVQLPVGSCLISDMRKKAIGSGFRDAGISEAEVEEFSKCRKLLESDLSHKNYADRFELLLECEKLQEEKDIRAFDMTGCKMKLERNSGLVTLEIPGLQENRPSVLRGDKLYVRESRVGTIEFEGYVHNVGENQVWLSFHEKLIHQLRSGFTWDVRFSVSPFPINCMQRAVKLAEKYKLTNDLFPSVTTLPSLKPDLELELFDENIKDNPEQLAAVKAIVNAQSGAVPYIVFGPPGTGKTVTLVESIKQVFKLNEDTHIIATAPSNTAADLLASRLSKDIPIDQMLRIHASSRARESIPDSIKAFSNLTETGYSFPPLEVLSKYKIIIITLITSGKLVSAMFPEDHFKHVFIDEAGQATEPETCVALAGLLASQGSSQIVMAGDPKQLGPTVRSSLADKAGLSVSMLERLMSGSPYISSHGYNDQCITKLTRNFRSHPGLLSVPAKLFYSDELLPCAEKSLVDRCLNFSGLTNEGKGKTPLLVFGVEGQDMREEYSPSFFNPEEIVVVLRYVEMLLNDKTLDITESDIGIITPYRRQVQKIQDRLQFRGLKRITVGTTEEFQGQERQVIILSTVRSSAEYLHIDSHYRLGFLADSRRFNVAITRSQALLIVVGNPTILYQDKDWKQLLDYANSLGCYEGSPFPESVDLENHTDNLTKLLFDDQEYRRIEESGWKMDY